MKAWNDFVKNQETRFGKKAVDKWLRSLKILRFDAGNLYLVAQNTFQANWFKEHIQAHTLKDFKNNNGRSIKVHLSIAGIPSQKKPLTQAHTKPSFSQDSLNPTFHFTNFYPGSKENFAFQILKQLTGYHPSTQTFISPELSLGDYNPIYIYGPTGCGKTHLLMATTQALTLQGISVFYVRAETFTEHVIRAFRSSRIQDFRESYRKIQVLIIDDVQFFARKNATQEELFHTFNRLHTEGLQMIFSADTSPQFLQGIEERLMSRFEWGITLPLNTLSQEDRKEILLEKMDALSLSLSPKLIEFLLKTFGNLSSLTQSLEAIALRTHLETSSTLTLESTKTLIHDLIQKEEEKTLNPDKVIKTIASFFGIKAEDILSKSQSKECTLPRQIAMYLCRKELGMSLLSIAKVFGRDHSTVISSVKRIAKGIKDKDAKIDGCLLEFHHSILNQ